MVVVMLVGCLAPEGSSATPSPRNTSEEEHLGGVHDTATSEGDADDERAALFAPEVLHEVRVSLGAAALARLGRSADTWVPAGLRLDGVEVRGARLRLRGEGDLAAGKPDLRISLEESGGFGGLARLRLEAMTRDPSQLRTVLGWNLLGDLGVPAPAASLATVWVNDAPLGLYANVEERDRAFLRRRWPDDDGDLWEGEDGADLAEPGLARFTLVEGDDPEDRSGLEAAREAVFADGDVLEHLATTLDVEATLTVWGAAIALGMTDTAPWTADHTWLYQDPDDGRFDPLPGETEQAFDGTVRWDALRTLPAARCLMDDRCRQELAVVTGQVLDTLVTLDAPARARDLAALADDAIAADPRRAEPLATVAASQERLLQTLEAWPVDLRRQLEGPGG